MNENHSNDPLHGVTLAAMVNWLVENLGWEAMGAAIPIRCFTQDPSVKSSLKFLRRTPWARKKVEDLYLAQTGKAAPEQQKNSRATPIARLLRTSRSDCAHRCPALVGCYRQFQAFSLR